MTPGNRNKERKKDRCKSENANKKRKRHVFSPPSVKKLKARGVADITSSWMATDLMSAVKDDRFGWLPDAGSMKYY